MLRADHAKVRDFSNLHLIQSFIGCGTPTAGIGRTCEDGVTAQSALDCAGVSRHNPPEGAPILGKNGGTKMRNIVLVLVIVVIMLSLGPDLASAQTQITLLGSADTVVFTSSGGPGSPVNVQLGSSSCGGTCFVLSDSATFQLGSFSITTTPGGTPIQLGTPVAGVFPVNMNGASIAFSFTSAAGNLSGTIDLTSLKDQPTFPQFVGTLTVTSTNNALFASLWPNGAVVGINLVINLGNDLSVQNVFNHTGGTTTNGPFFNGAVPPVAEPGSMVLLGSGLLAAGAALRRRWRG